MKQLLGIVMCVTLVSTTSASAQDPANRQLALRTELHPIRTLSLSDEQFLNGKEGGSTSVTVAGQLRIAQGTGRLPVVVMIHGSGGVDARAETWSSQFHEMSVSYPDCSTTYLTDIDVADRPIRIFHGSPDDANPVAPCKAYVGRLRGAGRDVQLTEYPNAHHSFDNPLGSPTPTLGANNQSVRHCEISEEPEGQLVNAATKRLFTYEDPCVERGFHTGYDPVASRAAHQAVGDFLKAVLKLP